MSEKKRSDGWPDGAVDFLLLSGAFIILAAWSWRKWPDLYADFGVELYVPWQISLGKALYRDLAYKSGPLSFYLNAFWFRLFGVSLRTLIFCNLAILSAITWMFYSAIRPICGRITTLGACLVFLCAFAFAQCSTTGGYNYVCPYSHCQTHGLALCLAMILAWRGFLRGGGIDLCALSGACLGLTFLTKAEILVPAFMAALAGFIPLWSRALVEGRRPRRTLAVFLLAAFLPVLLFLACLSVQMPWRLALKGICGNWAYLGSSASGLFYRKVMGLDDPLTNIKKMAFVAMTFGAVLAAAAGLQWSLGDGGRWRPGLIGLAMFAVLASVPGILPWREVGRILPLLTLGCAVALAAECWRHRGDAEELKRLIVPWQWTVLAFGLLFKILLAARISRYGFVLAAPAAAVAVGFLLEWLPDFIRGRLRGAKVFRAGCFALIGAGLLSYLRWSDMFYSRKHFPVGEGADAVLTYNPALDGRTLIFAAALRDLRAALKPGDTLLAIPEGAILNYFLRLEDPTPYRLFNPQEFSDFGGEQRILEAIAAHPPRYIVLMERDMREYGVGPFGRDPHFGHDIAAWILSHYTLAGLWGHQPLKDDGYGIALYRSNG